jgi:rRNA maturation endonuclease Nob1/TM2 domain-containing membrane protein YozV
MYCKKCGEEVKEDSKFCWSCGNEIEKKEEKKECAVKTDTSEKMSCWNCGKEIRDDSKFCWNCGGKIDAKEEKKVHIVEKKEKIPDKVCCWNYGEETNKKTDTCPKCGVRIRITIPKNPGVAAILSFFVPGLGHIYDGKIVIGTIITIIEISLAAIAVLLVTSARATEGYALLLVGVIFWIYNIYSSYDIAEKINDGQYK